MSKLNITRPMRQILTPPGIVLLTVFASFVAWAFPDFGVLRKGFSAPIQLLDHGLLYLLLWYLLIIGFSFFGFRAGKRLAPSSASFDRVCPLDDRLSYWILSLVSLFGFGYLFVFLANSIGVAGMLLFVSSGTANELKNALYQNYSAGFLSLRYVTILAGSMAMYRITQRVSFSLLDCMNVLIILMTAAVSSRLSFVMSVFIVVILITLNRPKLYASLKLIPLGLALFTVLSVYNASRNIGFYESRGNGGFWVAGLSEIITYLGSPFQGALQAGLHYASKSGLALYSHTQAGIEESLTTNSAFLAMSIEYGLLSFPIAALGSLIFGILAGVVFVQRRNYLILSYGVLMYCFAEIWRINLFDDGIVTTLLVFSVGIPFFVFFLKSTSRRSIR